MIIQKFTFNKEPFTLELPDFFRAMHITVDGGYSPQIWFMFEKTDPKSKKRFESYRDGVEIDSTYTYIRSYNIDLITYHLFMVRK